MKSRLFIALLVLAGAAEEQDPGQMQIISGKDNPELIPECVALQSVLITGVMLDAKYPEGAVIFAKMVGIREDAARAIIGYERARQEAEKNDMRFRDTICAKRAQLTSRAALEAELGSFERAAEARAEASVLAVYSVLSAEDAAKLQATALGQRPNTQRLGLPLPDDVEPTAFLNAACGR